MSNINAMAVIFLILSFLSCSSQEDEGGKSWNIKLSTNKVLFDSKGGLKEVRSKKDIWEIRKTRITIAGPNAEDTNVTISYDDKKKIKIIVGEWYKIEMKSSRRIVVEVKENETDKIRTIYLPVFAGNFSSKISIVQSGQE